MQALEKGFKKNMDGVKGRLQRNFFSAGQAAHEGT
jgi:hypothetical protein